MLVKTIFFLKIKLPSLKLSSVIHVKPPDKIPFWKKKKKPKQKKNIYESDRYFFVSKQFVLKLIKKNPKPIF